MKALVLAGGRGSRIDELSMSNNKCMIRLNNNPIIKYNLDNVVSTDIEEIVVVVGYRAEEIINYFGNRYKDRRITYVIQWEQKGLVHAIEYARNAIDGDDFMLLLGDEVLIKPQHKKMLSEFREKNLFGVCGILEVENKEFIKRTYTLMHDGNDRVLRLIEKPRSPLNNLMGTGCCVFKNELFDYIDVTPVRCSKNKCDE